MRKFAIAGALALALSTAACTPDETQQTLTALNLACAGLAVGTTVAVQVASTIPGAAPAASIAGTVGSAGGAACTSLLPFVQSAIEAVNASGQTAEVTATTTTPSGQKSVRRMKVTPSGQVFFNGTVGPSSGFSL